MSLITHFSDEYGSRRVDRQFDIIAGLDFEVVALLHEIVRLENEIKGLKERQDVVGSS